MEWQSDILGAISRPAPSRLRAADGVTRTATLVRFVPRDGRPRPTPGRHGRARRAVLFLHGWSDYFFNVELARFWGGQGFEFFALDMHNHGRSLRPDTHGGYVADLETTTPKSPPRSA